MLRFLNFGMPFICLVTYFQMYIADIKSTNMFIIIYFNASSCSEETRTCTVIWINISFMSTLWKYLKETTIYIIIWLHTVFVYMYLYFLIKRFVFSIIFAIILRYYQTIWNLSSNFLVCKCYNKCSHVQDNFVRVKLCTTFRLKV